MLQRTNRVRSTDIRTKRMREGVLGHDSNTETSMIC